MVREGLAERECGRAARPGGRAWARAFTLVEIIVVLVLIGILAGMVVPRMLDTADRQMDAEVRSVERLLSIAGERVSVAGEAVAVEFDAGGGTAGTPEGGKLSVLVRRVRGASAKDAGSATEWRVDPLIEPVALSAARVREARADGVVLDARRWRIVLNPGDVRADLEIRLSSARSSASGPGRDASNGETSVRLGRDALRADRIGALAPRGRGAPGAVVVDLDDAGRGTKSW